MRQRRSAALVVLATSGHNQVVPGLLSRLFGKPSVRALEANLYTGDETLEVVGESHYQDALWRIVGGHRRDPVRYETEAVLELEAGNRHDANAIRVVIHGALVGYLSREDAAAYRPGLLRLMETSPTGRVALGAAIVGGGPRSDGIGFLGVFLDHDPADFGLAARYAANGPSLRTGFSEAIATDLEDDSWNGARETLDRSCSADP
jgi:HIRAN domain